MAARRSSGTQLAARLKSLLPSGAEPLVCYFGHHKAATVTVNRVVRTASAAVGLRHVALSTAPEFKGDLSSYVGRGAASISYTSSEYEYVNRLRRSGRAYRGIHVIRDPRDVVVSGYWSHLKSHPLTRWPELAEIRPRLNELPLEEGLLLEIDFLRDLPTAGYATRPIQSMAEWPYDDPSILELRYEDLAGNELDFFTRALTHLGYVGGPSGGRKLSDDQLAAIVGEFSFESRTGRDKGQENPASHMRSGRPGGWREYFSDAVTEKFDQTFPGVVETLGYQA
jgi:hypothetical protein